MLYPTLPTGMTFPNDFKLFFPYLPYFRLRAAVGGESQFYRLSNFSQPCFTLSIKPITPAFMSVQTRYSPRIAPINDTLVSVAGCKADENKPYPILLTLYGQYSKKPAGKN